MTASDALHFFLLFEQTSLLDAGSYGKLKAVIASKYDLSSLSVSTLAITAKGLGFDDSIMSVSFLTLV